MRRFLPVMLAVLPWGSALSDGGYIDPSFAPDIRVVGRVQDIVALPSGKFLVKQREARGEILRLNEDGTLDETFPPFATSADVVVHPDGRLVTSGYTSVDGDWVNCLRFFTHEGAYAGEVVARDGGIPCSLGRFVFLPDGRFLASWYGRSSGGTGSQSSYFSRFLADGSRDPGFQLVELSPQGIAIAPDGGVILMGASRGAGGWGLPWLYRFSPDGSTDETFRPPIWIVQPGHSLEALAVQPDGKILVGGCFRIVGDPVPRFLVRFHADGTLDHTFSAEGSNGWSASRPPQFSKISPLPDGRLLVAGELGLDPSDGLRLLASDGRRLPDPIPASGPRPAFAFRRDDGLMIGRGEAITDREGNLLPALDLQWLNGAPASANVHRLTYAGPPDFVVARPGNGPLVAGAEIVEVDGAPFRGIAALDDEGRLDESFEVSVEPPNGVRVVIPLPGGRFFVGGRFSRINGRDASNAAVIDSHGTLLGSTDAKGIRGTVIRAVLLADGRVAVAMEAFSGDGENVPAGLAILDPDADPMIDASFLSPAFPQTPSIAALPDGSILAAGSFSALGGTGVDQIARVRGDGTVDPKFHPTRGMTIGEVRLVTVLPSGRCVAAGLFEMIGFGTDGGTVRALEGPYGQIEALIPTGFDRMLAILDWAPAKVVRRIDSEGNLQAWMGAHVPIDDPKGVVEAPPHRSYLWGGVSTLQAPAPVSVVRIATNSQPVAPYVTVSPSLRDTEPGDEVVLHVMSPGTDETYHWSKDGIVIEGETGSSLSIESRSIADAGIYTVTATNVAGTCTASAKVMFRGQLSQPVVDRSSPKLELRTRPPLEVKRKKVAVSGRASEQGTVEFSVNGGRVRSVASTGRWRIRAKLEFGRNVILVRVVDAAGNRSASKRIVIHRSPR